MDEKITTVIGTPNIALIKYWGKRDEHLNLPTNSSLSITLDERLSTLTSVLFSERIRKDTLYLNGQQQDLIPENGKMGSIMEVIGKMRSLSAVKLPILIVSKNSFPTSSGLASSASGAATLVTAISHSLGLGLSQRELSVFARQISGSGSRSLMGGFVKWNKGSADDGSDSYAEQVAPESHWPDVIDMVGVVTESKKLVSSSEGHKRTIDTSKLYKMRPQLAEESLTRLVEAIGQRDFETLAEITMRDSNNMHATMLDTYPPIMYPNDASREIVHAIHKLNDSEGRCIAGYTFDAGANAHIITLAKNAGKVREAIGPIVGDNIIEAGQGSGPRILGDQDSLIDLQKLLPK